MSWSLSVPTQESTDVFIDKIYDVTETPKPDGRTKAGKAQAQHVRAAKTSLAGLADALGAVSGGISGHVNADLSATVSISVAILAP
jgi:hypothetical protein